MQPLNYVHKGIITTEATEGLHRITMAWEGKWSTGISKMGEKGVPTCAEYI